MRGFDSSQLCPVCFCTLTTPPQQLSEDTLRSMFAKRTRSDDYHLARQVRMEVFQKTELEDLYPVWRAKKDKEAYRFSRVPYQFGYGFVFGMCFSAPLDFYNGCKAANWRLSGGIGKVRRESHYSAGRFAHFLGVLYFYETIVYKYTRKVELYETTFAAFLTASTLAAHHGWKLAVVQGASTAGFMFVLLSFTSWISGSKTR